jgi:hypothetical protein
MQREREPIERVDVVPAIPLAEPFNLQLTKHFNTHIHTHTHTPLLYFLSFLSFFARSFAIRICVAGSDLWLLFGSNGSALSQHDSRNPKKKKRTNPSIHFS